MSAFAKLLQAAQQAKAGKKEYGDENYFYYPAIDPSGNGSAVIRFLPGQTEDELPFVKEYSHNFKNAKTGKWFINSCPTSINQECPACAANSELYKTLSKDDARKHGMNRRTTYYSRILVVEDAKNPENVGKIYLFKYGSKIFDMILGAMQPEFDDEEACNVFSMEDGANFKLKIRKVEGQTSYDKSSFDKPSVNKTKIEYTDEINLAQFSDPKRFKSAEDLQKYLDIVIGNTNRVKKVEEEDDEEFETPKASKPKVRKEVESSDDDEDAELMQLMRKMAESED